MATKDKGKRAGFNSDEFNILFRCMNEWRKEKHNSYIMQQRRQFREYVLFMAATGLRVGEARNLRWRQIRYRQDGNHTYVIIDVMESKTEDKPMVARPETYYYLMGRGVTKNYVQAHKWFTLAAAAGSVFEWRSISCCCAGGKFLKSGLSIKPL